MGTFLLLLIIFFIVIPLVKALAAVWRARRQYRDFEDQFRRAFFCENGQAATGSASARARRNKTGATKRAPAKKKIDPNVGEYVDFQEVRNTTTETPSSSASTSTYTHVRVESQIEDAEWEDIK